MRRFIAVVCLLVLSLASHAQFEKHVIPCLSGNYTLSGHNIGFILHRANDRSRKQPIIIFLHGAGESIGGSSGAAISGEAGWSDNSDAQLGRLEQNHVDDLPYFFSGNATGTNDLTTRRFHVPSEPISDSVQFYLIAPQCYHGNPDAGAPPYWLRGYVKTLLAWIKTNLADEVDTTRIYLTGLSMGGGGSLIAAANPAINPQVAAVMLNCPGYSHPLSGGDNDGIDYKMLARSGLPIWIAQSEDDGTTDALTSTDGTKHAQEAIDSLNVCKQLIPYKYFKYNDATSRSSTWHTQCWGRSYNLNNRNTPYMTTNGYTVTFSQTIFDWFLQFDTRGPRVPKGY